MVGPQLAGPWSAPAARPAVRGGRRGMLPDGWIGPATGAAGGAMWPLIALAMADPLRAPVTLGTAPGVRPAVPALLGAVVAPAGVLDAELLRVAPHSKLLACLPALRHAPAAPHLPRPLAVHMHPPQEAEPGPALLPERAGFDSQRGRDCSRDAH